MNLVLTLLIFLSYATNILAVSYSLPDCYGRPIDQRLVEKMNITNGIFIEVGANDGITQSNTKLLEEQYGWTGILIEPSDVLFERLKKNRPTARYFQCALGTFEQNNTFLYGDFDGHLMASINGDRLNSPNGLKQVLTRSLQSILDELGITHINFFSLDTEGYEQNILKGIDFKKTTFDYLLIEIYRAQYQEIVQFLASHGYTLLENFSNYSHALNPVWDGTHNDYLFARNELAIKEMS